MKTIKLLLITLLLFSLNSETEYFKIFNGSAETESLRLNQVFYISITNYKNMYTEKDIEGYYNLLIDKGDLLISGFLEEDVDFIINLSIKRSFLGPSGELNDVISN